MAGGSPICRCSCGGPLDRDGNCIEAKMKLGPTVPSPGGRASSRNVGGKESAPDISPNGATSVAPHGVDQGHGGATGSAPLLSVFVPGVPRPAGSKRGFLPDVPKRVVRNAKGRQVVVNAKTGKAIHPVMGDSSGKKGKDWRGDVQAAVRAAYRGDPVEGPLMLHVTFHMPRPKKHYLTKGLRDTAPTFHTIAPDTTKLLRSVEDALTKIVWRDDAQISVQGAVKEYGERPGAFILVTRCHEPEP